MEELEVRWPGECVPPELIAQSWAALGESDRALDWLEVGVKRRSSFAVATPLLREFSGLYGHPRSRAVLKQTGAAQWVRRPDSQR